MPVLQTTASDDADAAARSPGYWVAMAGVFVVVSFLPLSTFGAWIGGRLSARFGGAVWAPALGMLPILVGFGLAAWGAGAVVGRFGGRAGAGSAALGGTLGGALTFGLGALGGALSTWNVAVGAAAVLLGGGAAAAVLGARFGRQRRPAL